MDRADELLNESLARFTATEDPLGIGWAQWGMGNLAARSGDHDAAIRWFLRSLEVSEEVGHLVGAGLCFVGIACTCAHRGQAALAARLFGASARIARHTGVPLDLRSGPTYDGAMTRTRQVLGSVEFDRGWAQGNAMTTPQATACARFAGSDHDRVTAGG